MKQQERSQENDAYDVASEGTPSDGAPSSDEKSSVADLEEEGKTLSAELKETRQELEKAQDTLLRSSAEFDNARKRMIREKEQTVKFANEKLLHAILPFLDDLDRALTAHSEEKGVLHEGIVLVRKKFLDTLSLQWKVEEIAAVGEVFDPLLHEAIAAEESADVAETTVIEEYQKGFMYHERVLRTAKVKVATKAQKQAEKKKHKQKPESSGGAE